ncbi:MAG TPA: RNA polymerase sigma factor RpoH [Rhodobiaceae bacterium]|nr:RNA polymerase sigma factor RpoH [Rhodobiaceae bacterium]
MAEDKTKTVAPTKTSATGSSTALAPAPSPEGSLSRYLAEIRKFPILEAQEEYELARDYAEKGNVKAAHTLVTSHLRLVAKIAMGYRGYGLPIGEVISEGNVGLMQAVKKFDAERGFRLATYAMWWIRASIQEYILRSWSLVKIGTTAAQKKLFFNLRRLKGEINAIDGGSMTPEQVAEIADRLGVQENEVEMMDGRMSTGDQSLNAPMRGRGAEGEDGGEWQDWLEDSADSQEAVLAETDELDARRQLLMAALATLNEREAAILQARRLQDEPETLEQLSEKFGVSRERIRQIEARAFEKLRDAMTEQAEERGLIEG